MRPIRIIPNTETRAGRMIAAGQVHVTVKSLVSGKHLTVRFSSCAKLRGKWEQVPLAEATHVFVREGAVKVANLYPPRGTCFTITSDKRLLFALELAVRFLNGEPNHPQAEVAEESRCGRCGKELTDPESIVRGIGPVCIGKETGSQHEKVA